MDRKEIENLKAAYNAVFDENDQMRTCGREACIELISLMKNYTSEDMGNEDTGTIEVTSMQTEYHKLIG